MDFIALEFFAQAVRPRQEVENIRRTFEIQQPQRLIACDLAAVQNPLSQFRDARAVACVKHMCRHG